MASAEHRTLSTSENASLATHRETESRHTAKRDELLRKMSPEKRALFEKISALRERIGPVKFDVVEALREIREDG
jgi:hypothetical protein